jgi:hypothetical protein
MPGRRAALPRLLERGRRDGDGDLKAKADIFAKFFALSSR